MSESFIFNKTVENYLPFKSLVDGSITNVTEEMVRGITRIDDYAFYGCETLTGCYIPSSVTSIGDKAFYYCTSLQSIEIPNGVTSIGDSVFFRCYNMSSVLLSDNLISIGDSAFQECSNQRIIMEIPSSVTSIGNNAFRSTRCQTFTMRPTTPPTLGSNVFSATYFVIYVPAESVETYKTASGWSDYASRIQAIPSS